MVEDPASRLVRGAIRFGDDAGVGELAESDSSSLIRVSRLGRSFLLDQGNGIRPPNRGVPRRKPPGSVALSDAGRTPLVPRGEPPSDGPPSVAFWARTMAPVLRPRTPNMTAMMAFRRIGLPANKVIRTLGVPVLSVIMTLRV